MTITKSKDLCSLCELHKSLFQELVEMVKAKKSAQALAMQMSHKWTAEIVDVDFLKVFVRRDLDIIKCFLFLKV